MLHYCDWDPHHRGAILFVPVSPAAPRSDHNSLFTKTGSPRKGFNTPVGVGNEHANSWSVAMGWSGMHAEGTSASPASSHIVSQRDNSANKPERSKQKPSHLLEATGTLPNQFLRFETRETSWTGQIRPRFDQCCPVSMKLAGFLFLPWKTDKACAAKSSSSGSVLPRGVPKPPLRNKSDIASPATGQLPHRPTKGSSPAGGTT